MKGLSRIANLYDLFERSHTAPEEIIIDYFNLSPDNKKVMSLSADVSLEADDDYVNSVMENG